jgi:hypothetical protein
VKWTKFKSVDDHDLGLSMFEMPWLGALERHGDKASFVIKYLGAQGSRRRWDRRQDGAYVLFEKRPLRVVEVVLPASYGKDDITAIVSVVRDFLAQELSDSPEAAAKYLEVVNEAAKAVVEGDRAAAV